MVKRDGDYMISSQENSLLVEMYSFKKMCSHS